jgi:filamentous hemagglutinin family protein
MTHRRFFDIAIFIAALMPIGPAGAAGTAIVRDNTLDLASRSTTIGASGTTTAPGLRVGSFASRSGPLGPGVSPLTVTTLTYNSYLIPESLGQRNGANVFHSFSMFNVGNGDAAVFNGFSAATNNVIARVTGGTASTIAGLLQVNLGGVGGAGNLFLVNPAGIVLAPGAAIDVPGSVHLTTANYLKFPDGNFHADTTRASTLSAADPAAFGFLGTTRAPLNNNANLPVAGSISLIGGDVSSTAQIGATGVIRITAVGQDTVEIPLTGPTPAVHGAVAINGTIESTSSIPGVGIAFNTGSMTYSPFPGIFIEANGGADISLTAANDVTFNGHGTFSGINTSAGAGFKGGNITLNVGGTLSLIHGGGIRAATLRAGSGGDVTVRAGNIFIDGSGYDQTGIFSLSNGTGGGSPNAGNTGNIDVAATGNITILSDAQISNTTFAQGNAGNITVSAGSITLDGAANFFLRDYTGITSNARRAQAEVSAGPPFGSIGNAGNISIFATDTLSILNGARISTSTYIPTGNSGNASVSAGNVVIDGYQVNKNTPENSGFVDKRIDGRYFSSIQAAAKSGSSGQTGNVTIGASRQVSLSNGGQISIQNDATVAAPGTIAPTALTVSAPTITLKDATITAASTGNVPASNVKINFTNLLSVDPSIISTASNLGNGGAISIIGGGGTLFLDHSQITTSVSGLTGNGGDISIQANALVMNTGFIQANTAAALAAGGNVSIGVNSLIASGNSLLVGGSTPYTPQPSVFGFNVIQAASPTGISGDIKLSSPAVDITRSLTGLTAKTVDTGGLGRSPCRITGGSSMAQAGRGGFAPSATDLLGPGMAAASPSAAGPAPALVARSTPADDSPAGKCL